MVMSFCRHGLLAAGCLWLGYAALGAKAVQAQSGFPVCPPPAEREYLLLIRGESEADRAEIASILPADNTVLVCQYLEETLVRAGGFSSLETANAWASYMTTVEGYESFVARPVGTGETLTTSTQGVPADAATTAYQPRRLGPGYAVLVDYGDRPEIAATVGQVVRPVGLAAYQKRAYLLADYTSDANSAARTLQRLSDAQLSAILVDAQQVVRLRAEISNY